MYKLICCIPRWLYLSWYKYLLEKPTWHSRNYYHPNWFIDWFGRIKCRWQGHPKGVQWFNSGGYEPDMHCKNCGDNLG